MASTDLPQPLPAQMPHLGNAINEKLRTRGLLKHQVAAAVGIHPTSMTAFKRRRSVDAALLWRLCEVLGHNFFADVAAALPAGIAGTPDARDRRIAELEDQLRIVMAERDVLMRAVGG